MGKIGTDIKQAAAFLKAGQLVSIPTETVYGLAANALDSIAVSQIFEAKHRPHFDPIIVHAHDLDQIKDLIVDLPPLAEKLAKLFWPGPLTLILPKSKSIPDLVTAGLDHVGIRIPRHPLTLKLLKKLDFPLAAPSANPFGYISPTRPEHVDEQLGDRVAYILDGGPCQVGLESTIIGFENGDPIVYRIGGLDLDLIKEVAGPMRIKLNTSSDPRAPGMLKSHYAPKVPVVLGDINALIAQYPKEEIGILSFKKQYLPELGTRSMVLSPDGDLRVAAAQLFDMLRALDKLPLNVILCEWVPDLGLGKAINDRLTRAAARD